MKITYKKLWKLLIDKNLKKTDLMSLIGISTVTLAKLSKDENVSTEILIRICDALKCNICAIVDSVDIDDETKINENNKKQTETFTLFDLYDLDNSKIDKNEDVKKFVPLESECLPLNGFTFENIKRYYDSLNEDLSHRVSTDDVCTPMECVKKMIDYVPNELWERENIRVLDPCAGNGNFGAYCCLKTDPDNIWYNELNLHRFLNCIKILNPKHANNEDAFNMTGDFEGKYDLVMANPPYSGGGNKNRSLSNDFIELAVDLLNDTGYLCFVTPNNWMTFNNNNSTLKKLLSQGTFVVIDNDAKKYFSGIGSSFTIIVWQKNVFSNKTKVVNSYLVKDVQEVIIPKDISFIPLYLSNETISLVKSLIIKSENNRFFYRCDLHNFTKKNKLSDVQNEVFKYPTIHTVCKTRYANMKQDIFDKWIIVIPLSTYYKPYIVSHYNTTQSVGYIAFNEKKEAELYVKKITLPWYKLIIHLTRYGNFNNIMVLKHLDFDHEHNFTEHEEKFINSLCSKIKY